MLHVLHAIQAQRLSTTRDVLHNSFPRRECYRMVRADSSRMPAHLCVLESGTCKVYQLSSPRGLD